MRASMRNNSIGHDPLGRSRAASGGWPSAIRARTRSICAHSSTNIVPMVQELIELSDGALCLRVMTDVGATLLERCCSILGIVYRGLIVEHYSRTLQSARHRG